MGVVLLLFLGIFGELLSFQGSVFLTVFSMEFSVAKLLGDTLNFPFIVLSSGAVKLRMHSCYFPGERGLCCYQSSD